MGNIDLSISLLRILTTNNVVNRNTNIITGSTLEGKVNATPEPLPVWKTLTSLPELQAKRAARIHEVQARNSARRSLDTQGYLVSQILRKRSVQLFAEGKARRSVGADLQAKRRRLADVGNAHHRPVRQEKRAPPSPLPHLPRDAVGGSERLAHLVVDEHSSADEQRLQVEGIEHLAIDNVRL